MHVIFVGLGREVRIEVRAPAFAMQRIFRDRGSQQPAFAVHNRNPHAERAKIHTRHNGHGVHSESDLSIWELRLRSLSA
jgi:hypothetical protein